jgi:hypothetical protein
MSPLINATVPVFDPGQDDRQAGPSLLNRATPLAPPPTAADAADWHRQNLADTWQAAKDPQFWQEAANQYRNALLMGTTAPETKALRAMTPGAESANVTSMDPIQHMLAQIAADPKSKWGVRVTPDPIEGGAGTVLPPSRIWDDGAPTDKVLSGTSTVGIGGADQQSLEAALAQAGIAPYGKPWQYYPGEHVYLVKGPSARKGYDDGERIIRNAQVVAGYRKADAGPSSLLPVQSDTPAFGGQGQK